MSTEEYPPYLYLYASMSKPEITNMVRSYCHEEENQNLNQTHLDWETATQALRNLETSETGIADHCNLEPIGFPDKVEEIKNDPLFKNSFSNSAIDFKIVDIENIVATQRNVSLNYVEQLTNKIPDSPTPEELFNLCISTKQDVPEPKVTQTQAGWIFSSPSVDFRFLGGFLKEKITEDDLKLTNVGAQPVRAITVFLGYGSGSINAYQIGNRLVLNNGFHRVYTLYKKGIRKIPMVIQKIGNPAIEFPPQILGLSADYLLRFARPIVVKDFFNENLTKIFKRKKTIRMLNLGLTINQADFEV